MKQIKAFIPNLLTLLNLVSGCVAITFAVRLNFEMAFWMVVLAAVFDFFDGFAARLLGVSSPMGKELDSLADVVSFGVTPSVVVYVLLLMVFGGMPVWMCYPAFLIAACSAYRLAKFNLDERQHEEFRGLATPACAMFFIGIPFMVENLPLWSLYVLVVVMSALLVSDIPMFSLKFKTFGLKENAVRYLFLLVAVVLAVVFGKESTVYIITCYILMSLARMLVKQNGLKKNN